MAVTAKRKPEGIRETIAGGVARGVRRYYDLAASRYEEALSSMDASTPVEFPNTGYYLPVIYGITGHVVEKLEDIQWVLDEAEKLIPPEPSPKMWLPYLGETLDGGMAALWLAEVIEALKYVGVGPSPTEGIWLGFADDVIMRQRGVEFVDGSAPGFAAVTGAAPDVETAVALAREMQGKYLYVFMAGESRGTTFAEQLVEGGVEIGWDTRLVPFGPEIYGHIYSVNFATRAAMAFGGVQPGDFARLLKYNKDRVFAFVLALGEVDDLKYAAAAGAINYGFPTIAEDDIPQILPTGVCTYEHVCSDVPLTEIVSKAIEVRGLKIVITEVPIPVAYGPAFEGERIRKDDLYVEMAGPKATGAELAVTAEDVEDGKVTVVGPDIGDIEPGTTIPFGVLVEVSGRKMQSDFEPILERQIHHFLNEAEGYLHVGQRDIIWERISKKAVDAGFTFEHVGKIIHARYHSEFGGILDKVQVTVFTKEAEVSQLLERAQDVYQQRDERLGSLTDTSVETFYSCTLCQSFAPDHVCVITPERSGLCGAYNWLDGKAAFEINPTGPNQPIDKGATLDEHMGQWEGVNEFVYATSHNALERFNAYSILEEPMTSCGCFEAISVVLPMCNGIMTVDRDHTGMTPIGMKFSTLAGSVGGGAQTPGFIGHSKFYMGSGKFISAEGGIARLVWMPKKLKEELKDLISTNAINQGYEDLYDKIATEENGTEEDEILSFLGEVGHPALEMDPLF
ncbi:MAG TPA: acetyl-CoA decarbonylase/synthase complex subunit alpha/beta [Thermoleophilia bacterium]|nr:acetyl-CoA decarbonylase/synthase complex subunit alpha/beta [Thermoleophilia bacterium]